MRQSADWERVMTMLICRDFDNAVRWQEGERLDTLFERTCDDQAKTNCGSDLAVITDGGAVTFKELDDRANQTARFLRKQGIGPGDRVGLLVSKSLHTYVAMLAILKINAAYVPLDASFPQQRISFIAGDADVKTLVTLSDYEEHVKDIGLQLILLDEQAREIDQEDTSRLTEQEKGSSEDQLCYIIYTSGTTGNPKGVAIEHPSICNFVAVAAETYGIKQDDRCYQGMTIAFDFSVEELWVPLVAGAALVPGRQDTNLLGNDLADYLTERKVTALCCVPTLLATIENDLPDIRFLLVSGEACPRDLVTRWHRPGRTFINAYGPTEASVTATLTEVHPDKAVTIGGPLPTYTIVILKEDEAHLVDDGAMGEICIAGIALAKGYVNRDDLTEKVFIPDFLDIANNPSKRIYRTGDLGRINDDGEVEFHGRIDTQVKIRGYRIELTEIESVFMEMPQVALAVVDTHEPEPGVVDLVAYYTLKEGETDLPSDELAKLLRGRLPGYMMPSYVERLAEIPMLPSHKADRKKLPAPAGPRFVASSGDIVAPRNEVEQAIAETLAGIMEIEDVSVIDNFFHDLGAHSLLMTQLSAELRTRFPNAELSMRDIYLHPTVAGLAEFIGKNLNKDAVKVEREAFRMPTNLEYYGCGFLQLLFYTAYVGFVAVMLVGWIDWVLSSITTSDVYIRTVLGGLRAFAIFSTLPILAKWILIGRWKPEVIPIWSLAYFRFWVVKTLIQTNPVLIFSGTPLYNIYLRLLGAKIGRDVVIQSNHVPVTTDLFSIGDNTILRKSSVLMGYKAQSGYIHTGPITLGRDVFVGEASVLDISTEMADGSQLGHSSSLRSGQHVPVGKRYHGSPAVETSTNYDRVEHLEIGTWRKVVYTAFQLFNAFFLIVPSAVFALYWLFPSLFGGEAGLASLVAGWQSITLATTSYILLISLGLFFGALTFGLLVMVVVPRIFNRFLEEDKVYPLYGVHYYLFNMITGISNSPYFNVLIGDSSYIVNYLKFIGYKVSDAVQTGSNFGTDQEHDNPFLCTIGQGTMVSDGLSMINAHMSSSSFKMARVDIGENNYIGNNLVYPPDGKTGSNVLMATKALIPIDGPVRENVGLLGSPAFEIPRSVDRDKLFLDAEAANFQKERVRKKNIHGLFTIASVLSIQWAHFFLTLLFIHGVLALYVPYGLPVVMLSLPVYGLLTIVYFSVVARWSWGVGKMDPKVCSIYDRHYWKVEHYWKRCDSPLKNLFKGTPFRTLIHRLYGTKVGRKVFDDGCFLSEQTLVEIGDYCTLNDLAVLQSHSLEDGVFKSDYIKLGKGCSIGANALVHYGTKLGDNSVLDPDSFLMKGEIIGADSTWRGNPAREV